MLRRAVTTICAIFVIGYGMVGLSASAHAAPIRPATSGRYSGDWPHAVDFQASEGWTGNVPSGADAASIDMTWAKVEPTKGNFISGWSTYTDTYDKELSTLHSQGKKAILILWYLQKGSGNNITSQAMPKYVFTDMGSSNYFYDSAGGSQIPNYFSSAFITDWQAYVSALATHFAASADVADIVYVRGMTGKGGETTPCLGQGFPNDSTCESKEQSYDGASSQAQLEHDYMNWLEFRTTDESNDFTFAYVVTPVDNWDGGATDPNCTYPSGACTYHAEWIYYQAGVQDSNGIHPFISGSNALPNNTGGVQQLMEVIAANISTTAKPDHYEFQEQGAAGSSGASVTEAKTAWCYSESDPDVTPGIIDLASVEFYTSVYKNNYAGPGDFHSYEDGTVDPGPDSSVCSGLHR